MAWSSRHLSAEHAPMWQPGRMVCSMRLLEWAGRVLVPLCTKTRNQSGECKSVRPGTFCLLDKAAGTQTGFAVSVNQDGGTPLNPS